MTASADAPKLPDRYRLLEVIGTGGMGRVYRAHDATLNREVAIKLVEREIEEVADRTNQRERFVREARAAARLVHPNIVAVHDVDPEAGWLVMAMVDGKSLRDVATPMPADRVARIAKQVLAGLDAAHANGVIHRDIKPSNILVGADGHVTIIDFGVARLVDRAMTKTGESLGTPAYMAPEQIRGAQVDARTDLYGLGATLFELVTGEKMVAFESPGPDALAKIEQACSTTPRLGKLIVGCLQADPAARFASADLALAALAADKPRPAPKRKSRLPIALAALAVAGAVVAAFLVLRPRPAKADPRLASAFRLAQRGEYERAASVLEDYLGEHPDDSDALTLQLLCSWWEGGQISDAAKRAIDARLTPAQRAMVHGIDLITQRRETEAAGYLANAEHEHPGSVEIVFALGEAQWHAQQYETGATTLARAFELDHRWQMALHHVAEYRLSLGQGEQLRPIANALRDNDAAAAAALGCRIAISEHDYDKAAVTAQAAIVREEPTAELYICLSQALALAGDLDAGERAAKQAFDLWPVDIREWGGFAHRAEYLMYHGKLDDYLALVREKPSRQRTFALALWRPNPQLSEVSPVGPGMRMPPFGAAVYVLVGHVQGRDETAVYQDYPEREVRAYGIGLTAEGRGDRAAAIAAYREALAAPQKGDTRMLVAHHLARVLVADGNAAGAAEACREVIAPRVYEPYRAVLLPDCILWSGDRKQWEWLSKVWTGEFQHPAVVEVRRLLH